MKKKMNNKRILKEKVQTRHQHALRHYRACPANCGVTKRPELQNPWQHQWLVSFKSSIFYHDLRNLWHIYIYIYVYIYKYIYADWWWCQKLCPKTRPTKKRRKTKTKTKNTLKKRHKTPCFKPEKNVKEKQKTKKHLPPSWHEAPLEARWSRWFSSPLALASRN